MTTKCPDCSGEMVKTKRGWECRNPSCDVLLVETRRGNGWKETKVVRRAIVIKGEKVKEAEDRNGSQ